MKFWIFGRKAEAAPQQKRHPNTRTPPAFGGGKRKRMFAAAEQDRLAMEWGTTPIGADDVIMRNWQAITARAQEQVANNDYGRQYLRMCVNNIVGEKGIQMQARSKGQDGTLDSQANAAIEACWKEWSKGKNCDVAGKKSLREFQKLAIKSAATTGEFFIRLATGAEAGPMGFAIQLIPSWRVPVEMVVNRMPNSTNFIRFGIEYTQYGRPVAYYFTTTMADEDRFMYSGKPFVRIPAEEIAHGYIEDIANQKRGLSWLATSLVRMRQLNGMEEAALVNARVGASKMAFMTFKDGENGPEYDEDDPPVVNVEPGELDILPQGASIEKWDPQYPAGEYAQFTKDQKRGAAAGMGVSYNNLAQDLEGVNFSSIRQGTLDERETWKDLQEWLTEEMMQKIFDSWLINMLLGGKILLDNGKPLSPLKLVKYQAVLWQGRRWAWIDPVSDVDASIKAKNAMLKSPSELIRDGGKDPDEVWTQTAGDIANQLEKLIAGGMSKKNAEIIVMKGYGVDYQLLQEKTDEKAPNGDNLQPAGK